MHECYQATIIIAHECYCNATPLSPYRRRSIDRKDRRLKVKVEGYFFLRWSFIMKEESFLLKYILTITSAAVAETGEGYNFSSI